MLRARPSGASRDGVGPRACLGACAPLLPPSPTWRALASRSSSRRWLVSRGVVLNYEFEASAHAHVLTALQLVVLEISFLPCVFACGMDWSASQVGETKTRTTGSLTRAYLYIMACILPPTVVVMHCKDIDQLIAHAHFELKCLASTPVASTGTTAVQVRENVNPTVPCFNTLTSAGIIGKQRSTHPIVVNHFFASNMSSCGMPLVL